MMMFSIEATPSATYMYMYIYFRHRSHQLYSYNELAIIGLVGHVRLYIKSGNSLLSNSNFMR